MRLTIDLLFYHNQSTATLSERLVVLRQWYDRLPLSFIWGIRESKTLGPPVIYHAFCVYYLSKFIQLVILHVS